MDAMVSEDIEQLKTLPNYKKYLAGGCQVKKVRSIYPTITYPCHTTMCTGVWPEKHGIFGNLELCPGADYVPWKWFHKSVKWDEDIFKAAKRAGLTTAAIFWPVTGNHPDIDYLIDEYWPEPGDTDIREVFKRAGSSEEVIEIIEEQLQGCVIRTHPDTDDFIVRCTRELILKYQPDLLMIHPANLDSYRHKNGLFNDRVAIGVEETDRYIGEIMAAVEEAGLLECTNFVLTSDHGHIDVKRRMSPNVLLAEAGLIDVDEQGQIKDWKAYCQSGGTSAIVYMKDANDKETYEKTWKVLSDAAAEGVYGFKKIYTEQEVREQEHLGGNFAFVLETDGITTFGENVVRPMETEFDFSDRRYGKSTHGHNPEKGPQPIFLAKGPAFKENVTIKRANLVDEAPTFAKVLGIELKEADGRVLNEFVKETCECGKEHTFESEVIIGEGVLKELPRVLHHYHAKKIFLVADKNTYNAAGKQVEDIVAASGVSVVKYVYNKEILEPNEENVGLGMMYYESGCDMVIGVGSGVINDICKIIANVAEKPYVIVATAPSMDGYASATSSMTRDGLKISLPSKCADVIIGDLDVLCDAPIKLMISGLGDMLAKYVSICEWRISALINGEYYCEKVAEMVRTSLKRCTDNAEGLLKKDKEAVWAVFEGLVICGKAMKYAGVSRPASGCEHYLSHVWDMRGVEFDIPVELHGLQCGVGTLIMVQLYEKLTKMTPDREKALSYVADFDFEAWCGTLRNFLGTAAESMIALEEKEQKYNKETHKRRLDVILQHWDDILKIMKEELPSSEELETLCKNIGAPTTLEEIGVEDEILPLTFKTSKDIRDKYVLSRLCWDLGVLDEII